MPSGQLFQHLQHYRHGEHVHSTPLQTAKFCLRWNTWVLQQPAGFRLEKGNRNLTAPTSCTVICNTSGTRTLAVSIAHCNIRSSIEILVATKNPALFTRSLTAPKPRTLFQNLRTSLIDEIFDTMLKTTLKKLLEPGMSTIGMSKPSLNSVMKHHLLAKPPTVAFIGDTGMATLFKKIRGKNLHPSRRGESEVCRGPVPCNRPERRCSSPLNVVEPCLNGLVTCHDHVAPIAQ